MNEREPRPLPCELDFDPWEVDLEGANRVLGAAVEPYRHPRFGEGHRWTFGEGTPLGKAQLELYRACALARFWSGWLRADLGSVERVAPELDALKVESFELRHRTTLLIHPERGVALHRTAREDSAPVSMPPAPIAPPSEISPTLPPSQVPAETATTTPRPPARERPARVVLTGRIGRTPRMKTTSGGRAVAQLPLAVHRGEQTSWHTVLFFDAAAEQAVEKLAKGQLITIVGYRHAREITTRTGETRTVEEIYVAAVQAARPTEGSTP